MTDDAIPTARFEPIGVVRTAFRDPVDAPRQPYVAGDAPGRIELYPGRHYEDALADVDQWSHLWVIYWFHRNTTWRPKVLPPRSTDARKGVFSTRAPHRPNPIGISAVRLDRVEGLVLHVRGVDMLDGTPVLDLKPYVPFADSVPDATTGWITPDPSPPWSVVWSPQADTQRTWLAAEGVDLGTRTDALLALGPQPHAYRRIRVRGDARELSLKDWRVDFTVGDRVIHVTRVRSGYRASQLDDPSRALHRRFVDAFGG